ncbi:MAG: hypothetical protein AAF063_01405 [Cyanobacteria bacterium J06643_5]
MRIIYWARTKDNYKVLRGTPAIFNHQRIWLDTAICFDWLLITINTQKTAGKISCYL